MKAKDSKLSEKVCAFVTRAEIVYKRSKYSIAPEKINALTRCYDIVQQVNYYHGNVSQKAIARLVIERLPSLKQILPHPQNNSYEKTCERLVIIENEARKHLN